MSNDDNTFITNTNLAEERCEGMNKGIDVNSSDSDNDDRADKPRVHKLRSKSVRQYMRRAEKVWAFSSTTKEEEDESQKPLPEPEEKVGDVVRFGKNSYLVIDIFEKEIMELGDEVDLNFNRFNKVEVVDGYAPRDHHFYNYRCCNYYYCYCASSSAVERQWTILERDLASREKEGVSFFVKSYKKRRELMRVAVTVTDCHQNHSLFFFDLLFPKDYPYRAPIFFYHPYALPLTTPDYPLKNKTCYNILDVFLHIQEIVLMNTNKSCQQMLDVLKDPLVGFEDFVKGYFRKKGALILRNLMEEIDMDKERERKMFWKMYIAFEDNKAYCEHLLNSDLKAELEKFKDKEYTLGDYYNKFSSTYYPTFTNRFDGIKKTSNSQNFWSKLLYYL